MHLPKVTYLHPFKVEATNTRNMLEYTWLDWSHKKSENKKCLVFLFAVHGRKKNKKQSKAKSSSFWFDLSPFSSSIFPLPCFLFFFFSFFLSNLIHSHTVLHPPHHLLSTKKPTSNPHQHKLIHHLMSSKPHPGRISTSSPSSPMVSVNLSRDNSAFYSEPKFEDPPKKKPSGLAQGLFPSPTLQTAMLDIKSLPQVPTEDNQPTVALTAATPIHPQPRISLEGILLFDRQ